MKGAEIVKQDLVIRPYLIERKTAKFDILLNAIQSAMGIHFDLEYSTDIFKRRTMENFAEHFINIISAIVNNPETKIKEIEMISKAEKEQILHDFNDLRSSVQEKTIHQLFEEQVERTPDSVALVFDDSKMTYRDLNRAANQIARLLRAKGIKSDQIVGLMIERSFEMIIGLLGILKAGGAYLAIDPEYPAERIEYILKDSKASILLTDDGVKNGISFSGEVISVDCLGKNGQEDDTNLLNLTQPNELVYVIYTSGSTGKPKGVMLEHRNLVNLMSHQTEIDFSQGKVLQFTTVSFDVSFQEIFMTLLNGGELYLLKKEIRDDFNKLFDFIEENEINILYLPASFLKFVFNQKEYANKFPRTVKHILAAGEQLIVTEQLRQYLQENNVYLHNHYGPSETHVVTMLTILPDGENPEIPAIGKPITNTQIYIVNNEMALQPVGIVGELCIAGENVGRGYLLKPELTAEKFIQNPFGQGLMYKTGDLARWLDDGNIQFIGRKDHQVKIRGFRVELGEIEEQLLNHSMIKEAVVIAKVDVKGDKYLVAYIVPVSSDAEVSGDLLRVELAKKLPDYMIPTNFVLLPQIPLTPNGKVDRRSLPEPDGSIKTKSECIAPASEIEERLLGIWSDILGTEKISITDNFFNLGGHSLRAALLSTRVYKNFGVELPVREIFRRPTIKGLAKYIQNAATQVCVKIEKVAERVYYPLSSAQRRLYVVNQLSSDNISYNLPIVLNIEGEFNLIRFESAFKELFRRHESFRTSFELIDGEPMQKIHADLELKIDYLQAEDNKEVERLVKEYIRPFDLCQAPLLRVGLIEINERYVLIIDMHHIISDGFSLNVIIEEFVSLYEGQNLAELQLQYKDFAVWQNQFLKTEKLKMQEKYWLEQFAGEIPRLKLPTMQVGERTENRQSVNHYVGDLIEFVAEPELASKLKDLAEQYNVTLYMLLLSAFNILLTKYTGQEEIIVGSPIAGRTQPDLEKIIGMFVNTLVMKNNPGGSKAFTQFLAEVRENALKAYENQDYQFEMLVEKLELPRDLGRNPLFDVMFAVQNAQQAKLKVNGSKVSHYQYDNKVTKFDLNLNASELSNGIYFALTYRVALFKKETIERMATHLLNILREIATNPEVLISEITMIYDDERQHLLYGLNETSIEIPAYQTIQGIFEEQVEKTPDAVALIFEGKTLTYQQVNGAANRVAVRLRQKGVCRDQIVGILVDRSFEMIIGILGILKAGGTYMPISSEYPQKRIKYMLEDSETRIVLVGAGYGDLVDAGEVIELAGLEDDSVEVSNPEIVNEPTDLAYLLYTSGSTGKPKGVMVEHRSVINTLSHMQMNYPLDSSDTILQSTVFTFDASVREIFWWFFNGSRLCLLAPDEEKDPYRIIEAIAKYDVTIVKFVPVMLNELLDVALEVGVDQLASIKYVFVGGEALLGQLVRKFYEVFEVGQKLCNLYGPTESTIHCTENLMAGPIEKVYAPLGRPISNVRIYILDQWLKPVPVGVIGEIYIAGVNVAREYINNPKLTNERFIPDPFVNGERMYKSGDLGRWHNDGTLDFIGRIDHQVKIRGNRIELGEIENQLLTHEAISEAVVIDRTDSEDNKYLCVYYVSDQELSITSLKTYVAKELPDYMLPSYFMRLDNLPLTANGKIDRKALPEPLNYFNPLRIFEEPRDDIEAKLLEIWKEVLKTDRIDINDDFFEIGGNSIMAIKVIVKANSSYNLQVKDIFTHKTIKELASIVRGEAIDEIKNEIADIVTNIPKTNLATLKVSKEKITLDEVLLTGATGFLGSHVLEELLSNTDAKVYCLVRGKNAIDAKERLMKIMDFYFDDKYNHMLDDRIIVIHGDLTKNALGLDQQTYATLGEKVSTVIHTAALVKHFGDYAEFEKVNVKGTKEVIGFSEKYHTRLFMVSTTSVSGTSVRGANDCLFTENDFYIGQNYENSVYVRSKFEAENLVFKAINNGLSAAILRVGNLTGRYLDGHFQMNVNENAFYNQLKTLISLGVITEGISRSKLQFTPVDCCSKAIVEIVQTNEATNRVYHLFNQNYISTSEMVEMLKHIGIDIEIVDEQRFRQYIHTAMQDEKNAELISMILAYSQEESDVEDMGKVKVDSVITEEYLRQIGFEWVEVDEGYIGRVIRYLERVGFIR